MILNVRDVFFKCKMDNIACLENRWRWRVRETVVYVETKSSIYVVEFRLIAR